MKYNFVSKHLLTALISVAITAALAFVILPQKMFLVTQSKFDFTTTVLKLQEQVAAAGWVDSGVNNISQSVKRHSDKNLAPVAVIKVCNAEHAYQILVVEKYRHLSALMPCSMSIYEDDEGNVFVAHLNTRLMGYLFTSPVREIMTGPVADFLDQMSQQISSAGRL